MTRATVTIWCVLSAAVVGATPRIDPNLGCRANPGLVAPCFEVEGTVQSWNGTPTFRLRTRRSHRILGIASGEDPIAPKCLAEAAGFEKKIEGTFVVCPFSRDQPGHMRTVCVDEVVRARVFDAGAGGRWHEIGRLESCRLPAPSK
jgi:hypothetical protein